MDMKYYKFTKVKRHKEDQNFTFVPVGSVLTGYLAEDDMPKKDLPFTFSSERLTGGWIQTSLVKEIDEEVEPGITFIKTLNSIYKLEELEE